MTPVFSRTAHDPSSGLYGDCHSAALATVLDLSIEDVPLFFDHRETRECHDHVETWLESRGLAQAHVLYSSSTSIEEFLATQAFVNPRAVYLLGVSTPSGAFGLERVGHTVVCVGDTVVHDPSREGRPLRLDLYEPMVCGVERYWWQTFVVPLSQRR